MKHKPPKPLFPGHMRAGLALNCKAPGTDSQEIISRCARQVPGIVSSETASGSAIYPVCCFLKNSRQSRRNRNCITGRCGKVPQRLPNLIWRNHRQPANFRPPSIVLPQRCLLAQSQSVFQQQVFIVSLTNGLVVVPHAAAGAQARHK